MKTGDTGKNPYRVEPYKPYQGVGFFKDTKAPYSIQAGDDIFAF